jgi:hypothetical protein
MSPTDTFIEALRAAITLGRGPAPSWGRRSDVAVTVALPEEGAEPRIHLTIAGRGHGVILPSASPQLVHEVTFASVDGPERAQEPTSQAGVSLLRMRASRLRCLYCCATNGNVRRY